MKHRKSRAWTPKAAADVTATIAEKARARRIRQRALTELSGRERSARRNDLAPRLEVRFTPTECLKPASRQVRRRDPVQGERIRASIKGQPKVEQLLIEEAARLIKVKVGDAVVHIPKQQALIRKLFDAGLHGDLQAARFALLWLERAQAAMEGAPPPQQPLSADEIELLKLMAKGGHSS